MTPKVLSIVATSGTGKTTLLEKLIVELKGRGYRIGALKHDAHRFEIDHKGKDSWRFTQAGADTTVIASTEKIAMVKKNTQGKEADPRELIEQYFSDVDIVLTEGFKKSPLPKIEVNRKELTQDLLCRGENNDPTLIAIASDNPDLALDVPVFHLNDVYAICDFIEQHFFNMVPAAKAL